jgi:hypothetical protein
MIYDFDIYSHPELLIEAKKELDILHEQIKIVEGLEHARARIAATRTRSLDSNTLSKCDAFVRSINNNASSTNFNLEVHKLSLDELAFCSISFEERRLKSVIHHFKASEVQTYMKKTQISCLDRPEIFRRLKRLYAESEGKPFQEVFTAAHEEHNRCLRPGSTESDGDVEDGTDYDWTLTITTMQAY